MHIPPRCKTWVRPRLKSKIDSEWIACLLYSVALSAYYKRHWTSFSVKLLVNIGTIVAGLLYSLTRHSDAPKPVTHQPNIIYSCFSIGTYEECLHAYNLFLLVRITTASACDTNFTTYIINTVLFKCYIACDVCCAPTQALICIIQKRQYCYIM